jgi:hypothetical protein
MRRIGRKHVLPPSQAEQVVFAHQAQYTLVIDELPFSPKQSG